MKLDALVYLIRVSVKILKGERICFQFFQNLFLRPPIQTLSQTHKIHAQNGALGILTFRWNVEAHQSKSSILTFFSFEIKKFKIWAKIVCVYMVLCVLFLSHPN